MCWYLGVCCLLRQCCIYRLRFRVYARLRLLCLEISGQLRILWDILHPSGQLSGRILHKLRTALLQACEPVLRLCRRAPEKLSCFVCCTSRKLPDFLPDFPKILGNLCPGPFLRRQSCPALRTELVSRISRLAAVRTVDNPVDLVKLL